MYRLSWESHAIPPPAWQQLLICTGQPSSTFSEARSSLSVDGSKVKRETWRVAMRLSRSIFACGV
ncbi:hypothetical protein SCALM49S_09135 [Streptomyces californicus]